MVSDIFFSHLKLTELACSFWARMFVHFAQTSYNLRNDSLLQRRRNRKVYFGTESISSLTPKIWELVICEIKNARSLDIFKEKLTLNNRQISWQTL